MEITANALQTVNENQNVLFTDTVICGSCSMLHRNGSGLITVKGITDQCRARFKVTFGGNIAIPADGTVEEISLAISLDGEAIGTTTMIVTPAAVEEFWNVYGAIFVEVPKGCCYSLSVQNISTQPIEIQNANFIHYNNY